MIEVLIILKCSTYSYSYGIRFIQAWPKRIICARVDQCDYITSTLS